GLTCLALGLLVTLALYRDHVSHGQDLEWQSRRLLDQVAHVFHNHLEEMQRDLSFLAHPGIFRDWQQQDGQQRLRQLSSLYAAFSQAKGCYDQIRFLDDSGMERVRINHNGTGIDIVPEAALQSKADRYYFHEIRALLPGQMSLSSLDLNIEGKQVELPLKPVLRLGTPVADGQGNRLGLVILNLRARPILDELRQLALEFPGRFSLLNPEGVYLLSEHPELEWSHLLQYRPQNSFPGQFPLEWESIRLRQARVTSDQGVFLSQPLAAPGDPPGALRWWTVAHLPADYPGERWQRQWQRLQKPLLMVGGVATLLLWLLLHTLEHGRQRGARLAELHRQARVERDLFIAGPALVLQWQRVYGWPFSHASTNVQTVLGYDPLRFQRGELSWASLMSAPDLERLVAELEAAVTSGRHWVALTPFPVRNASGAERWLHGVAGPLWDTVGHVTGFQCHVADITALRATEERLNQAHQSLQHIIDSLADPLMVMDVDSHQVSHMNRAARDLYGTQSGSGNALGTCHWLTHRRDTPCDGSDHACPIQEVLRTGQTAQVEHHHMGITGETLFMELRCSPLFDDTGRVTRVVETQRDMTRRHLLEMRLRKARREAEAANHAKSQFLTTMSHDIRTPLNAVLGMTDLLLDTTLEPQQREYAQTISQAGNALLALVNNVLDLSRIEAGEIQFESVPFSLEHLVAGTLDILRSGARQQGVELTHELAPDLFPWVLGDPERLREVLFNLLGNALKYTRDGVVQVRIGMDPEAGQRFSVADSGVGIAPEDLALIFEPFRQVPGELNQRVKGTGLGLAICRQLVMRMGGRIWAESTPGVGSTFHFTVNLPSTTPGSGPSALPRPDANMAPSSPQRILLVDDSEEMRALLAAFLKGGDHELHMAVDGMEAVARYAQGGLDLILMDMEMPRMDGWAAIRAIRTLESEQGSDADGVRIIAITGHAGPTEHQRCLDAGADICLTKPVTRDMLQRTVAVELTRPTRNVNA
ncbi:MAG: ATP-binding protein, partial [Magnetococcus sp. WYHC-3]